MKILALSQAHDAGACLVEDGQIHTAINEERITREKGQAGFPAHSIAAVLENTGLGYDDIDCVVIPTMDKWDDLRKNVLPNFGPSVLAGSNGLPWSVKTKQLGYYSAKIIKNYSRVLVKYRKYEQQVRRLFPKAQLVRVEHHLSHAASAYYTSGFEEALIVTADAQGDFVCLMVALGKGKDIEVLSRSYYPNSLGIYYLFLTMELGFKPNRHEGKIVGLAAYGDPNSPAYSEMCDLLQCRNGTVTTPCMGVRFNDVIRRLKAKYSREDIAAVYQRRLEEVTTQLVGNYIQKHHQSNIALAGGVFANVKLNQRVLEIPGVDQVFIYPNMSDGGISTGGALYVDIQTNGSLPYKLPHVYLDRDFSEKELQVALEKANLTYIYDSEIEKTIARLIAEGHVVARFSGGMEYGPRALGNRSILYHAKDPSVNDWLNQRLGRSEFMPFAPVTMKEQASKCYKGWLGAQHAAKFMTITFDCTHFMKKVSPASVHVDGTARPQILERTENPGYYRIVEEYFKLTGIPSIINTSFNMHEEPIVRTPDDAIRAFKMGHLEYLAMGPFLVEDTESVNGNRD